MSGPVHARRDAAEVGVCPARREPMRAGRCVGFVACVAAVLLAYHASADRMQVHVLDDFRDVSAWRAAPSDGVDLALASETGPDGPALRIDFDFRGHGGWAAVRRPLALDLPPNWEIRFRVRGDAPVNDLEFKLVDRSGDNVWWRPMRRFEVPREWRTVTVRKRQIAFAWGPNGGGEPKDIAAIELAIVAGSGGRGTIWISDLTLTPRDPDRPYSGVPIATATSDLPGRAPAQALGGSGWHSDPAVAGEQAFTVDFGEPREVGGVVVEWDRADAPRRFIVEHSLSGEQFEPLLEADGGVGMPLWLPTGELETRFVRLRLAASTGRGFGVARLGIEGWSFDASPSAPLLALARASRRGLLPRGLAGELSTWTVAASARGGPAALVGADGAVEPRRGGFSLEPFVLIGGRLVTWADVSSGQELPRGRDPMPRVRWRDRAFELDASFTALRTPAPWLLARYRIRELDPTVRRATLLLAARPFQVNPPAQFLGVPGGVVRVAQARFDGDLLRLDGLPAVLPLIRPAWRGVSGWAQGEALLRVAAGRGPRQERVEDSLGRASAVLAFEVDLVVGEDATVEVLLPMGGRGELAPFATADGRLAADALATARRFGSEEAGEWQMLLDRASVRLGGGQEGFPDALGANLAFILASRDGAALRPGTRAYARSWIRDGAMMAAALLRLGHEEAVRDYLRWYATFLFNAGKVPCCVDERGSDPVAENDANGQFLFLAAEYLRFTGDTATIAGVWPRLVAAAGYIDHLRQQRRTEAYRAPEKLAFFGLLPESISHEGYSAKPMHSYWDDFWALKGLDDAVLLAERLGEGEEAKRWRAWHDEFRQDLIASIARVREAKGIAYLPGCAELGDFDATSSTVALWPAGVEGNLPRAALDATWERYWHEVEARFTGTAVWDAYTPYEWRSVGAMVRLGWRERAVRLARWLMADRMPAGWSQWPEVVYRDTTTARFIGDLPHAWVGSDFIRSFLDMLAFERPDGALVLFAGLPADWLEGEGVAVRELRTPHGRLSFSAQREGDTVRVRVEAGLRVPPGGIVLRPPLPTGAATARMDGTSVTVGAGGEVVLRTLPAEVVFEIGSAAVGRSR